MNSVAGACRAVLLASDPDAKIRLARATARDWRLGRLRFAFETAMPDAPTRPSRPELVPPNRMPRRGKGGSARGRIAMLHALAHIEFAAIDLAFDIVGRFGAEFPPEFTEEFLRVGAEEAMHFALLRRRLRALGSDYGALAAHDGLWEAASATTHDPLARLAVVPMVLEARGLDVTPMTIDRFVAAGDQASGSILQRILKDEIRHVAVGVRWFRARCALQGITADPHWVTLVRQHFHGSVKPPFNASAREAAGLTREFYVMLAPGEAVPQCDGSVVAGWASS